MTQTSVYTKLANFGKELLSKTSVIEGLPHISKYVKDVIGADRCSIFIYDTVKKELWTTLADGVERIIVPSDKGVVGETIKLRKAIIVNDAYANPLFMSEIDKKTGYTTKNIITAPIFNSKKEVFGVLELLNKKDDFLDADVKYMTFFTQYISGFLELVKTYDEIDESHKKGKK